MPKMLTWLTNMQLSRLVPAKKFENSGLLLNKLIFSRDSSQKSRLGNSAFSVVHGTYHYITTNKQIIFSGRGNKIKITYAGQNLGSKLQFFNSK